MSDPVSTTPVESNQPVSDPAAGGGEPPAVETPANEPVSFVNPDGTLKEGWQDNLVPEDFRGKSIYNRVGTDVASLLRHIGHQDSVIGKQGKGIFPPGPEATQTEKDIFYKALGRPDNPDGYKIDIDESIVDPAFAADARAVFHKAGLTQAQVDAVIALDKARMEASNKDLEENPVKYFEELLPKVQPHYKELAEKELRKRWGDAYDSRMHLANRAIEESFTDAEDKELILSRAGNDPLVADLLATVMLKYATSGTGPDTSDGNPVNMMNIDQRIQEMMADPNYADGRNNPGRHKYLVAEVQKLFEMKHSM